MPTAWKPRSVTKSHRDWPNTWLPSALWDAQPPADSSVFKYYFDIYAA